MVHHMSVKRICFGDSIKITKYCKSRIIIGKLTFNQYCNQDLCMLIIMLNKPSYPYNMSDLSVHFLLFVSSDLGC